MRPLTKAAILASCLVTSLPLAHADGANQFGELIASVFANWQVPKGDISNFTWSNAAACQINTGAVTFPAFRVGTPIRIVESSQPANTEVVTPFEVSINGSGCIVRVNPVHQHFSFYITSATAGVQEALNYAGAQPFSIALTPDWARAGGTTSLLASVKGSATILDRRTAQLVAYTPAPNGAAGYVASPLGGGAVSVGTINGKSLPATLAATDVGADPAGAATSAQAAAIAASDPAGAAAAAQAAAIAASDPIGSAANAKNQALAASDPAGAATTAANAAQARAIAASDPVGAAAAAQAAAIAASDPAGAATTAANAAKAAAIAASDPAGAAAAVQASSIQAAPASTQTITQPVVAGRQTSLDATKYTLNGAAPLGSVTYSSTLNSFGDSITCGYSAANPVHTPPFTRGEDCSTALAYPSLLASQASLQLNNYAIPADQACDLWPRQIAPNSVSPTVSATSPLSTVMIGTNDANAKGTGPYEAIFNACHIAALSWLAIPAETKTLPAAATVTSGWTVGTQSGDHGIGNYAISSTAGGVVTFPITTFGGPIYLWFTFNDAAAPSANSGTFTYAVDGGSATSVTTQAVPAMSTQNGTKNSVTYIRLPGLAAGAHSIAFTNVSGTVAILGVGTPPLNQYFQHPVVVVGDVPTVPGFAAARITQYSADVLANVRLLQGDGLDVRFASNHSYMLGSAGEVQADNVHPTALGAAHYSQAFGQILQPVALPQAPVSLASPPAIGNTTPAPLVVAVEHRGNNATSPATIFSTYNDGTTKYGFGQGPAQTFLAAYNNLGYKDSFALYLGSLPSSYYNTPTHFFDAAGMALRSNESYGFASSATGAGTANTDRSGATDAQWTRCGVGCVSFDDTTAFDSKAQVKAGSFTLTSLTPAACTSATAGTLNYQHTSNTAADVAQVCAADATGTYAYRSIYSPTGAPAPYPSGTPTIAVGSAAGTGATANLPSQWTQNNGLMTVVVNTGTSPGTAGPLATMTFSQSYASSGSGLQPNCVVSSIYNGSNGVPIAPAVGINSSNTLVALQLATGSNIAANTSYAFNVQCSH